MCDLDALKIQNVGLNKISKSAQIDASAKIGPNCSIGSHTKIGEGCRIINSIILDDVTIEGHSLIKNSIIGWNASIGPWCRIEGSGSEALVESYQQGS